MTSTKCFFKVSGEFITDHARTRLLEDSWEDSLHILKDCLIGSSYEVAVSVLQGEQRLEGINTVTLESEDPKVQEQWQKKLAYLFCGIVRQGNDYWRSYAYVDGWCAADLDRRTMSANRYHSYEGGAPTKLAGESFAVWATARNNFYMNNPIEDRATWNKVADNDVCVLWQKVRVPPPWIKVHRDWQAAVDEFVQHKQLDHRGGHLIRERAKESPKSEPDAETVAARERFEQEQEAKYQSEYAEVAGKIDVCNLDTSCGWLSPEGKLIPCLYSEHDFYALVILQEKYGVEDSSTLITRGDALIRRGWVKLQNDQWWFYPRDREVTQSQYDTIWEHSRKRGLRMPEEVEVT